MTAVLQKPQLFNLHDLHTLGDIRVRVRSRSRSRAREGRTIETVVVHDGDDLVICSDLDFSCFPHLKMGARIVLQVFRVRARAC
jgi:hypothetical protein